MNSDVRTYMDQVRRNTVGRLVLHAETALKLEPLSTPEMLEAMFPGGFQKQTEWLTRRLDEIGGPQYTPFWFGFDDGPAWPGMHNGSTWNGWAKPQFSKEVADDIVSYFNAQAAKDEPRSYYAAMEGAYVLGWEVADKGDDDPLENYFYRRDSKTGLYPLGSGSLTWNLYTEEEAVEINDGQK